MNDIDIETLEQYITTGKSPLLKSVFFKECKQTFDDFGSEICSEIDKLNSCDLKSLNAIIKEIDPIQNHGRKLTAFVFAVYAKSKFHQLTNNDIKSAFQHL